MDFYRSADDSPEVILVDGLWGTGKSLVAPIISSLTGAGPFKIDQNLEVMTAILANGKISEDAFRFVVLNRLIENHFNSIIGREINLRPGDDSSFHKTLNALEILKRLTTSNVDGAWADSRSSGDALVQVTHLLGLNYRKILENLSPPIKIVNLQRNPILLVKHWETFLNTFSKSRELTPSHMVANTKIPFFAADWDEEWIASSNLDRALLSISRCSKLEWKNIDSILGSSQSSDQLKIVFFSKLIEDHARTLHEITTFLRRKGTGKTSKFIRREFTSSLFGFQKAKALKRQDNEHLAIAEVISKIESLSSKAVMKEFRECVTNYQEREENFR